MKSLDWRTLATRVALIVAAAAAPTAFPLSQMGIGSLHQLALELILPGALFLAAGFLFLRISGRHEAARLLVRGGTAGAVATLALEAVRYSGFKLGFMPGNLPELMGVLLLDRFALGPSVASTLAGFAYHFWNGACFGVIFALLSFRLRSWWAIPYGILLGVGFLVSPVVQGLGVGIFGVNFGWHFAATVLTAHLAFGAAMAWVLRRDSAAAATRCRSCGVLAS